MFIESSLTFLKALIGAYENDSEPYIELLNGQFP